MNTCILVDEKEILGIVARHLAKHNNTAVCSARWLGELREIGAPLLAKSQRKKLPLESLAPRTITVCEGGQEKTMKVIGTTPLPSPVKSKTRKGEKS